MIRNLILIIIVAISHLVNAQIQPDSLIFENPESSKYYNIYNKIQKADSLATIKILFGDELILKREKNGFQNKKFSDYVVKNRIKIYLIDGKVQSKIFHQLKENYPTDIDSAAFAKVQKGMTYNDVVKLIGYQGVNVASRWDVGGLMGAVDTQTFMWVKKNSLNHKYFIHFKEGKVSKKNQLK